VLTRLRFRCSHRADIVAAGKRLTAWSLAEPPLLGSDISARESAGHRFACGVQAQLGDPRSAARCDLLWTPPPRLLAGHRHVGATPLSKRTGTPLDIRHGNRRRTADR
jgi:hypothetical protein